MVIIPLNHGKCAVIDDCDEHLVRDYGWSARKEGNVWYAYGRLRVGRVGQKRGVIRHSGKHIPLHRLIMGFPKGKDVDHRDRDGLNCCRYNLREATRAQNIMNSRMRSNNSTGFRGVYFDKARSLYAASIFLDRKQIHLGRFPSAVEAAEAYNKASLKYHGEFGYRNLIPSHR